MRKFSSLVAFVVLLGLPQAWGFDYARYQATDLDALMTQPRPARGVDIYPALPLKLTVTLVSYAESCETALLKKTMLTAGIAKTRSLRSRFWVASRSAPRRAGNCGSSSRTWCRAFCRRKCRSAVR